MRAEKVVTRWTSIDAQVEAARARAVELTERSRQASEAARAASERVADVERDDRARRASIVADGESDPGADRKSLDAAERAAAKAGEDASIVADARDEALRRLSVVCDERREPWERAASAQLAEAASALRNAVADAERSYRAWLDANRQLALSRDGRKSGGTAEAYVVVEGRRAVVSDVIRTLAELPDRDEPEPDEPEPEVMDDDERRAHVAAGGTVEVVRSA
jgi:hypothetical protein